MPGKKIIYHASEPVLIERNNSNLAILIEEREVMVLILNHKVISSWAANSYLMIENDHESRLYRTETWPIWLKRVKSWVRFPTTTESLCKTETKSHANGVWFFIS